MSTVDSTRKGHVRSSDCRRPQKIGGSVIGLAAKRRDYAIECDVALTRQVRQVREAAIKGRRAAEVQSQTVRITGNTAGKAQAGACQDRVTCQSG